MYLNHKIVVFLCCVFNPQNNEDLCAKNKTVVTQGKINYDYFYDLDFSRFSQKQISVQVEEEKTKSTFEKYTKRPKTIRD